MGKKKGGNRGWMNQHVNDPWVQRAQAEGWRSRASFKLLEIDARQRLLRPGMTVVDLGAAPGGWSQVAAKAVGRKGTVVALDRLEMDPIEGVTVLHADFEEQDGLDALLAALPNRHADLVLSDMAPNISGIHDADQARSVGLAELALDLAQQVLAEDGALVVKIFQGAGFDDWLQMARGCFAKVQARKPEASRPRSREVYAVATGFRGG